MKFLLFFLPVLAASVFYVPTASADSAMLSGRVECHSGAVADKGYMHGTGELIQATDMRQPERSVIAENSTGINALSSSVALVIADYKAGFKDEPAWQK